MSEQQVMTRDELLANIQREWDSLQAYLITLTPDLVTRPTDAAGWTVKDHVAHLAVWEDSMNALLNGRSRAEFLGIPAANAAERQIARFEEGAPLEEIYAEQVRPEATLAAPPSGGAGSARASVGNDRSTQSSVDPDGGKESVGG